MPVWSALRGRATMGTPRQSASSTVFDAGVRDQQRRLVEQCQLRAQNRPPGRCPESGPVPPAPTSRPSCHFPRASTSCASMPPQAARILRKTGGFVGSGMVPSEAKISGLSVQSVPGKLEIGLDLRGWRPASRCNENAEATPDAENPTLHTIAKSAPRERTRRRSVPTAAAAKPAGSG